MSKSCTLQQFVATYSLPKGNPEKKLVTNTRIPGDKNAVYYSFSIPDDKYDEFLNIYKTDVIDKNKNDSLTEKQLLDNGPLLVDLDIKYELNIDKRLHNEKHIDDLLDYYVYLLGTAYKMDKNTKFKIFVMEKPNVNRVEKIQKTKDGIHLIFTLQVDRATQVIFRNKMVNIIKSQDLWTDLPIINEWEDIFDEGITKGTCGWQLYGSKKPDNEKYKITYIYEVTYDETDGECIRKKKDVKDYDINIKELSVRNSNHIKLELKEEFIQEHNEVLESMTTVKMKRVVSGVNRERSKINMNSINNISCIEDINDLYNDFIDNVEQDEYILKEAALYTMGLSSQFYGVGSYNKWIQVMWALKNTSEKLLIVWIKFSSQSESFSISDVYDLIDRWENSEILECGGKTDRSIVHWLEDDNPKLAQEIKSDGISYWLDQTIYGIEGSILTDKYEGGEVELAKVLHQMYKNEYVCTSYKANIWYRYTGHKWTFVENGFSLRRSISDELRNLYMKRSVEKSKQLSAQIENPNLDDAERQRSAEKRKLIGRKIINIIQTLNRTQKKDGILKEAKEKFYDPTFINKLDTNPYLICFNNGVFDFKNKEFRNGKPDDYLSFCTNSDYIELTTDTLDIQQEINTFMTQLFPRCDELRRYVWEHLASTLVGTTDSQTFNMYIGKGQNGKSVLVSLMEKILGDYKGDVPLSIITDKRQKVGGLSPELAGLKGKRYALMQEPSKHDVINECPLKQYTSGEDNINARDLYSGSINFKPQLKLIVTTNHFMRINTDDWGTWRRIRVIPFESLFTENPVQNDPEKPYQYKLDTSITREKFPRWKEVFVSMLVKIACDADLSSKKVTDCDIVLEESRSYRASQDRVSAFVIEKIVRDKSSKIEKNEINHEFKQWWSSNYGEQKMIQPKDVHEYLDKAYGKCKAGEWKGIKIQYNAATADRFEDEDIDDIDENDL